MAKKKGAGSLAPAGVQARRVQFNKTVTDCLRRGCEEDVQEVVTIDTPQTEATSKGKGKHTEAAPLLPRNKALAESLRSAFEKQQQQPAWVAQQPGRAGLPMATARAELLEKVRLRTKGTAHAHARVTTLHACIRVHVLT